MPPTNVAALRDLQQSLPVAQKLFALLAEQPEPGECITVDELIEALDLGRRNAVDLLRDLAEARVGEFRLGRKGHPSRLVWSTDPRQLAASLLGSDSRPFDPDTQPLPESDAGPRIAHVFVLRPGLRIHVSLPQDLSAREATALGDWVRNLSFER
jgi:hypothetical protein